MPRTNRNWLPRYLNPDALLPKIPETRAIFTKRPFLAQDFIGKAISFLESDDARRMGFIYDPRRVVPCRWKCSDESLFSVDLAIFGYTRSYPFDKGKIGGRINPASLGAAVHHGTINVDIGGSHVGYVPDDLGGSFGKIWRPATQTYSTDCGYLMNVLQPFQEVYKDACKSILVFQPEGERALISIPNEYVQPSWSSESIKLLVDLETLTEDEVAYDQARPHTHTMIDRSLFYLHPQFLAQMDDLEARELCTPDPTRIGRHLGHRFFNIWDTDAELIDGLPRNRLLMYMKFILAARHSPSALKAAVVNTALSHNKLTDAVRAGEYRNYDFVSFSGIFIDQYSREVRNYVNLFQPLGMTIKPQGRTREHEFSPEQIHEIFDRLPLAKPAMPLEGIFGHERPQSVLDSFTFEPGRFSAKRVPETSLENSMIFKPAD